MAKIIDFSSYKKRQGTEEKSTVKDALNFSSLSDPLRLSIEEIANSILPVSIRDNEVLSQKVDYLAGFRPTLNKHLYLENLKGFEVVALADLVKIGVSMPLEEIRKRPTYCAALFDAIESKKVAAIKEIGKI